MVDGFSKEVYLDTGESRYFLRLVYLNFVIKNAFYWKFWAGW
jgi:hypothetical protein